MSTNTSHKKPRQNLLLPSTTDRHRLAGQLDELVHWLWHAAPATSVPESFSLLRMYISLISDSVMPASVARETLLHLRKVGPSGSGGITLPAQRDEHSKRHTCLTFGPKTRLAIYCATSSRRSHPASRSTIFGGTTTTDIDMSAILKKELTQAIHQSGKNWSLTVVDISELAPFAAVRNGAEPFHFTLLSGRIRPVSQDPADPYLISGVAEETFSHLFCGHSGAALCLRGMRADKWDSRAESSEPPPEWIAESRLILRTMCEDLKGAVRKRCNTSHKRESARQVFANAREMVPSEYPTSCVTRVAIDFAEHLFINRGNVVAGTIRTYLSRCVTSGLLTCDASYSLDDWDPDDFFDSVEERINNKRLSARTKGLILHSYNQFLKFACPKLRIPTVSLSGLKQQFVGGAGQWRLVSPHAIDRLLSLLVETGDHSNRQTAVAIALAYYSGLRAGEIRRLTLADILFDEVLGLFEIEVVRGKSTNSRRRMPFHAVAPDFVRELIREEWKSRRAQFSKSTQLSRIALLGPKRERVGFHYHSLSSVVRTVLKASFGSSANVHLLRHSFCSNLFVRWYSLRYPEVLDDHRDRSHEIYQLQLQSKLGGFFNNLPGQEGKIRPYDLVTMIKITGHASPRTLFVYYVHSYAIVHSHTVNRIARGTLDESFTDKEIMHLVPGMRSSASRARLKNKTILGICRHRGLI